jgi:glycosyltransferase involved in cell wall biosynthesis
MTSMPHAMTLPLPSTRLTLHSSPQRRDPMVLHVRVVANSGGGPDKTVLRSAAYARPHGYRMAAAYIHPAGDPGIDLIRQQARQRRCPLWTVPETTALDPRTITTLLALCRRLNVRVWHGHDYKSNLLGLMLRPLWPMKLVTTAHGWTHESRRMRMYEALDRTLLRRYDHVLAVSPLLYDQCRQLGVPEDRLTYVANGIVPGEYEREHDREALRHAHGIGADRFVIGTVGRLGPEKGIDRAIRTLAALRPRHPNLELHLIGDGPQRGALQRLVEELDVRDAVIFHGWQKSAKPFYEMFDLLLLSSHTEGLPNVVLEAMAMHVPVAATDVGGVRDLLDNGRCGVVLNHDERTWPNYIAPLLSDSPRRVMLARRARLRIEEHFSFDRRMTKVMGIYDRVLQRVRPAQAAAPRRAA